MSYKKYKIKLKLNKEFVGYVTRFENLLLLAFDDPFICGFNLEHYNCDGLVIFETHSKRTYSEHVYMQFKDLYEQFCKTIGKKLPIEVTVSSFLMYEDTEFPVVDEYFNIVKFHGFGNPFKLRQRQLLIQIEDVEHVKQFIGRYDEFLKTPKSRDIEKDIKYFSDKVQETLQSIR